MAAMFRVTFNNGEFVQVYIADAKSFKKADICASRVKAIKKAKAKMARWGFKNAKVTKCRCVG